MLDMIANGVAHGDVASALLHANGDTNALRPWFENGSNWVQTPTGQYDEDGKPKYRIIRTNALGLRKDEWVQFDRVVIKAARERLRAWADLRTSSTYSMNGFGNMLLEHERMSDPGEVFVDYDGMTEGRRDAPRFELEGLPLPITHSPFFFAARRLAISRNGGMPVDLTMAEAAGRRVAEEIERTTIGTVTGLGLSPTNVSDYHRAPKVYGYTNFPDRVTKTDMTVPTGTNANATVDDVLDLRESLKDLGYYGPYMLYTSTDWDRYLDQDYSTSKGSNTLRQRLLAIEDIQGVRRLDFLDSTFTMLLVQMTSDVARAVNGMEMTTVRWETKGGARMDFRVMAIQVPQLRSDINGSTGIAHGTTA